MDNMSTNNASKNVLNSDVEIKGNLKFTGELTFDGKLDGEIHTDGVLNLGDGAVINGNINAQSVVVRGKVNGNINCQGKNRYQDPRPNCSATSAPPNWSSRRA